VWLGLWRARARVPGPGWAWLWRFGGERRARGWRQGRDRESRVLRLAVRVAATGTCQPDHEKSYHDERSPMARPSLARRWAAQRAFMRKAASRALVLLSGRWLLTLGRLPAAASECSRTSLDHRFFPSWSRRRSPARPPRPRPRPRWTKGPISGAGVRTTGPCQWLGQRLFRAGLFEDGPHDSFGRLGRRADLRRWCLDHPISPAGRRSSGARQSDRGQDRGAQGRLAGADKLFAASVAENRDAQIVGAGGLGDAATCLANFPGCRKTSDRRGAEAAAASWQFHVRNLPPRRWRHDVASDSSPRNGWPAPAVHDDLPYAMRRVRRLLHA